MLSSIKSHQQMQINIHKQQVQITTHNLLYLLKGNIVLNNINESVVELFISSYGNKKSRIIISYENKKPLYILVESSINDLCKKIESINENIDNYEFIEDVVYELNKFINDDMRKISIGDLHNIVNKIKEDAYLKYSNIDEKNSKSMLSVRASIEMLCDQLIKIHTSNNMLINNNISNIDNFTVTLYNCLVNGGNDVYISINIKIDITNILTVPPVITLKSNKQFKYNLLESIEKMDLFTDKNNTSLWTIKYCLFTTLQKIYEIINICGCIEIDNETSDNILIEQICKLESILKISNDTIKQNKLLELFDKDLVATTSTATTNKKGYWAKGTGYGTNDDNSNWDINNYIKQVKNEQNDLAYNMLKLAEILLLPDITITITTNIIPRLTNIIKNYLFNDVIDINIIDQLKKALIVNKLFKLKDIAILVITYLKDNNLECAELSDMFGCSTQLISSENDENLTPFQKQFNKYRFRYSNVDLNIIGSEYIRKCISPSPSHITRLQREFQILKKSTIISENACIFFTVQTDNICKMRFIISGPKNTPYEYGLFIFNMTIPLEFPAKPPICILDNTGGVRFNPNLYVNGYVCSSILNTWRGLASESWTPELSTIFQIFMSIQSQILVEQPYFNEPGYEKSMNTPNGQKNSNDYNEKIMQYTLEYAMINLLESTKKGKYPEFDDVIYEYFAYHKHNIINTLNLWENKINFNKSYFKSQKEKFINICPEKV
jgi:ubiquitin-protein ligase